MVPWGVIQARLNCRRSAAGEQLKTLFQALRQQFVIFFYCNQVLVLLNFAPRNNWNFVHFFRSLKRCKMMQNLLISQKIKQNKEFAARARK